MNSHNGKAGFDTAENQINVSDPIQDKFEIFLMLLAESSNIKRSAAGAGLHNSAVYQKRRHDAAFARKWLAALYEGYLHLELEVVRRLREGEVQGQGKDKYDFANALGSLSVCRESPAQAQWRKALLFKNLGAKRTTCLRTVLRK